jgi:hypothetical protein
MGYDTDSTSSNGGGSGSNTPSEERYLKRLYWSKHFQALCTNCKGPAYKVCVWTHMHTITMYMHAYTLCTC